MDADRLRYLNQILAYLRSLHVSLTELLTAVLVHNLCTRPEDGFLDDLTHSTRVILGSLLHNSATAQATCSWAHDLMCSRYSRAVQNLADRDRGWHFGAMHAAGHQIREFRLENMADSMRKLEPQLWELLFCLLGGREALAEDAVDEEDAQYWIGDDEAETLVGSGASHSETKAGRRLKDRAVLIRIKAVVVNSIFMHALDQNCNALQSTMGVFLHSCNAPEKLVKVLSRMGLSISLTSIHQSIESLSRQSHVDIEALGRTLLTSHAFDNFDARIATLISTLDKPTEGLLHLTSGTLLRLQHAHLEDLRCAKLLWDRSERNRLASDPRPFDPKATMFKLYTLHPEPVFSSLPPGAASPGLSRRGRFRAWHFAQTLLKHGPKSFNSLLDVLPIPEPVESIPLSKLYQTPLRAMDINQSTVSGNIEAILNMFRQAGLGNPVEDADCIDPSEYVVLVHGDLGTCERVLSGLRRRSQEQTAYDRLQSVVFVMGFFHLKMAAADAIWRVLVTPNGARDDDTSFMKLAGELRPNESSRLVSNAKFRQQHELVGDIAVLLELDAWRVEVKKRFGHNTLEEWAAKTPTIGDIEAVAEALARNYVEGEGVDRWDQSRTAGRDRIQENTKRTLEYLLLYEELAYAMNAGDIGRVETLFPAWIQIFRATGKHKYAHQMLRFIHNLYFVYPDALRCVAYERGRSREPYLTVAISRKIIRYNILVNPTGKAGEFRAVDWIVELLNLYIKVSTIQLFTVWILPDIEDGEGDLRW
ncbi:hypothetical protein LXA43DRAFT_900735 [Ganoderma leucocontextum]|nr:hypothetical protein LXA43DRAFT_900735 [Ganoderma leucocontextum]